MKDGILFFLIFITSLFHVSGQSCYIFFFVVIHLSSHLCFYLSIISFLISFLIFSLSKMPQYGTPVIRFDLKSTPVLRLFLSWQPTLLLAAFPYLPRFFISRIPFSLPPSKSRCMSPADLLFDLLLHVSISLGLEFSPLSS